MTALRLLPLAECRRDCRWPALRRARRARTAGGRPFVFLTVPLAMILVRSVEGRTGEFVGLANFVTYVQTPALAQSTRNTLVFALLTTAVTVPLAFLFAYAIQRSCIPFKGLWRNIAMIPILAPSLLAALSFIYLFGNQAYSSSCWVEGSA
jgi:iron(III) transport system permease protein